VALRIFTGNSEPVYLDKPGYRERLRPSKRRNVTSDPVIFSVDPVMEHREQAQWETLLEDPADGMRAQVVRLGAGKAVQGPDPRAAGGYYVFVGKGSMLHDGQDLPKWSMVAVENEETGFEIRAGAKGLEALVLEYPRGDLD
jgi:hypothetical protein